MPPSNVPGDAPAPKVTLYKVTQKLPNGTLLCKVFDPAGMNFALADLLAGVDGGQVKTVDISSLQLDTKNVNLEEFFKTGGALFSLADIK